MTTKEATAEVFWTAFRALTKKERETFGGAPRAEPVAFCEGG